MDKATAIALLDSIEHWHRMYLGTHAEGEAPYADDCALCECFLTEETDNATDELDLNCSGCPVYETTGQHGCDGTPWRQASRAWRTPNFPSAALEEISFLVDLLPNPGELHEDAEFSCEPPQNRAKRTA